MSVRSCTWLRVVRVSASGTGDRALEVLRERADGVLLKLLEAEDGLELGHLPQPATRRQRGHAAGPRAPWPTLGVGVGESGLRERAEGGSGPVRTRLVGGLCGSRHAGSWQRPRSRAHPWVRSRPRRAVPASASGPSAGRRPARSAADAPSPPSLLPLQRQPPWPPAAVRPAPPGSLCACVCERVHAGISTHRRERAPGIQCFRRRTLHQRGVLELALVLLAQPRCLHVDRGPAVAKALWAAGAASCADNNAHLARRRRPRARLAVPPLAQQQLLVRRRLRRPCSCPSSCCSSSCSCSCSRARLPLSGAGARGRAHSPCHAASAAASSDVVGAEDGAGPRRGPRADGGGGGGAARGGAGEPARRPRQRQRGSRASARSGGTTTSTR